MDWFEKVNRFYSRGYYTNEDVKVFVRYNKITPEQYKEITGEEYKSEGLNLEVNL